MAVITVAERAAIQQRLMAMGSANLALIFGDATGEDAAWTLNQAPSVVVVNLIGRLSDGTTMTITVCDALVKTFPNHPHNAALTAIADRLRAQGPLEVLGASIEAPPPGTLPAVGRQSDERTPPLPQSPRVTCIENGDVHFVLTEAGHFDGGTDALRRVAADLIEGAWSGDVAIHHAYRDGLQRVLHDLAARKGLSADEGKKLEQLRREAARNASTIESVRLAVKLAFVRVPNLEWTWGVPMPTEEASAFLAGLFVEARLTPPSVPCNVRCRLYVPGRTQNPLSIDLDISEAERKAMRASWEKELMPYKDVWRSWDWSDLVPVWHLRDSFIAARLLPAIALHMASTVRRPTPPTTMVDAWQRLRHVYPHDKRDPLVPYHWCLAMETEMSSKDLARHTSPPKWRSELHTLLGFQQ